MIYTNRFSLGRTEGEWRDECRAMNERSAEKTDQPRYRKKGEAFFQLDNYQTSRLLQSRR